jgi:hopanoid biosynthesis associated protein HpnK
VAHTVGILTAASLMVTAPAAQDAIEIARRLPRLRVGLHLVLVEGRPLLPPEQLSHLVDGSGYFRTDMAALGFDIFARPAARRQLRAEIEAQFAAFRAAGLAFDHVNAHKHFHVHPTIGRTVIAVARRYGVRGLRLPIEPRTVVTEGEAQPRSIWSVAPWAKLLGSAARRAGMRTPDAVFGLAFSGAMDEERLVGLLRRLPEGLSEIYVHPATCNDFEGHAPGYRYAEELDALTSPATLLAARHPDVVLGGYSDF